MTTDNKLERQKKFQDNQTGHLKLKLWHIFASSSLVAASISCLVISCSQLDLSTEMLKDLKIPRTVGDAKYLGALVLKYQAEHYYSVFAGYISLYILLQSLCIPGTIVLSLLSGYLLPAPIALLIICSCSTLGATNAYIITQTVIHVVNYNKSLMSKYEFGLVERFNRFIQAKIKEYRSNMFLCVFILRATPVFPNWAINLCSPIVGLPLKPFIFGTFAGVAPLSVMHVWTGRILNDLSNDESLVNLQTAILTSLVCVSIVSLVYIRRNM